MKAIYTLTLTKFLGLGITLIGCYSLPAVRAQDHETIKPVEPQIIGAAINVLVSSNSLYTPVVLKSP